jgi:F0F1-type ATP synthase delta subunit
LRKHLLSLPVVKLTIAFEPNQRLVDKLATFFSSIGRENVIFDILVDRNIVAGAVLEVNGAYRDYSVSKQIDQVIKSSKLMS